MFTSFPSFTSVLSKLQGLVTKDNDSERRNRELQESLLTREEKKPAPQQTPEQTDHDWDDTGRPLKQDEAVAAEESKEPLLVREEKEEKEGKQSPPRRRIIVDHEVVRVDLSSPRLILASESLSSEERKAKEEREDGVIVDEDPIYDDKRYDREETPDLPLGEKPTFYLDTDTDTDPDPDPDNVDRTWTYLYNRTTVPVKVRPSSIDEKGQDRYNDIDPNSFPPDKESGDASPINDVQLIELIAEDLTRPATLAAQLAAPEIKNQPGDSRFIMDETDYQIERARAANSSLDQEKFIDKLIKENKYCLEQTSPGYRVLGIQVKTDVFSRNITNMLDKPHFEDCRWKWIAGTTYRGVGYQILSWTPAIPAAILSGAGFGNIKLITFGSSFVALGGWKMAGVCATFASSLGQNGPLNRESIPQAFAMLNSGIKRAFTGKRSIIKYFIYFWSANAGISAAKIGYDTLEWADNAGIAKSSITGASNGSASGFSTSVFRLFGTVNGYTRAERYVNQEKFRDMLEHLIDPYVTKINDELSAKEIKHIDREVVHDILKNVAMIFNQDKKALKKKGYLHYFTLTIDYGLALFAALSIAPALTQRWFDVFNPFIKKIFGSSLDDVDPTTRIIISIFCALATPLTYFGRVSLTSTTLKNIFKSINAKETTKEKVEQFFGFIIWALSVGLSGIGMGSLTETVTTTKGSMFEGMPGAGAAKIGAHIGGSATNAASSGPFFFPTPKAAPQADGSVSVAQVLEWLLGNNLSDDSVEALNKALKESKPIELEMSAPREQKYIPPVPVVAEIKEYGVQADSLEMSARREQEHAHVVTEDAKVSATLPVVEEKKSVEPTPLFEPYTFEHYTETVANLLDFDGTFTNATDKEVFEAQFFQSLFADWRTGEFKPYDQVKTILKEELSKQENANFRLREGAIKYLENLFISKEKVFILSSNFKTFIKAMLAIEGLNEETINEKLCIYDQIIKRKINKGTLANTILNCGENLKLVKVVDDSQPHRENIKNNINHYSSSVEIQYSDKLPLTQPQAEVKIEAGAGQAAAPIRSRLLGWMSRGDSACEVASNSATLSLKTN